MPAARGPLLHREFVADEAGFRAFCENALDKLNQHTHENCADLTTKDPRLPSSRRQARSARKTTAFTIGRSASW